MESKSLNYYRYTFKAMGSPCDIQLFADTQIKAKRVTDAAIADVCRLEALYSRYRSDSFLSAINRVAATGGSITVDEETAGLLNYAATCYDQSDGLFDITSGILRRVWRFDLGKLPDQAQEQELLDKVGWHKLRWAPRQCLSFPSRVWRLISVAWLKRTPSIVLLRYFGRQVFDMASLI